MYVSRWLCVIALIGAGSLTPAAAQQTAAPKPPKTQISEATREQAADENANPDALVLADFQKRVDGYMAIHHAAAKDVPRQKETNDPARINAVEQGLAAKIRAARISAKQGEILTPEIQNKFRRLMFPVVQGPSAQGTSGSKTAVKADVKDQLKENTEERKEEGGKPVVLKVNATYPSDTPLPTTPPQVLKNLPKLPAELEYRLINKNLIIRDVDANIIIDFVPNAIQ
jgi:hypothetical protein